MEVIRSSFKFKNVVLNFCFTVVIPTDILKLPKFTISIFLNQTNQMSKIKDPSLASWGRKEIELAEVEMPGLISIRH
jgi:hypothetical protein